MPRPSASAPPPTTTRLPGAVSSLKVQLSPHELSRPGASTSLLSPSIQPSDLQLLATSVLTSQRRSSQLLFWQEQLLGLAPRAAAAGEDARPRAIDRATLKRALTHLDAPAWLAVLDERFLAGGCPYPACPNPAPVPSRTAAGGRGAAAAAYRISLRERTVRRNTAADPGDRETFCGVACFRRAQWVRQWVLDEGGGGKVGRWEREGGEEAWRQVELLEEMEESGEVARLVSGSLGQQQRQRQRQQQQRQQQPDSLRSNDAGSAVPTSPSKKDSSAPHAPHRPKPTTKPNGTEPHRNTRADVEHFLSSLTIHERIPTSSTATPPFAVAPPSSTATPPTPANPVPWTTDLPNTVGTRFAPPSSVGTATASHPTVRDTTSDDDGDDGDDDEFLLDLKRGVQKSLREMGPTSALLAAGRKAGKGGLGQRDGNGGEGGVVQSGGEEEEGGIEQGEQGDDLQTQRERAEVQRMMDLAVRVRDQQRELGLLE